MATSLGHCYLLGHKEFTDRLHVNFDILVFFFLYNFYAAYYLSIYLSILGFRYGMMRDCWQEGPAQRLGFRRMRDALEKVLAGLDRRPEANKFVFHMHENMLSILENVPGEKC